MQLSSCSHSIGAGFTRSTEEACRVKKMRFWLIFAGATSLIVLPVQLLNILFSGSKLGFPSLVNLCAALMVECFEEAVFRGISASYLMRQ